MLKRQTTYCAQLLIVALLLLALTFSVIGATVQSQVIGAGPTAVIACNGGSEGACGG